MARYPGFIFGSDPSQSPLADPQRTVNWYPEQIPAPGVPSNLVLYPTPGWKSYASTDLISMRAIYAIDGRCYTVVGSGLFEVFNNKSTTQLNSGNSLAVDDNPAQIVWNGAQDQTLVVASGNQMTRFNTGTDTYYPNPLLFDLGVCTITIASPAVITYTDHGLVAGDTVMFLTDGALPTGLAVNTVYYVLSAGLTSSTFRVSLTAGGTAVNTSGTQSGTHQLLHGTVPAFQIAMIDGFTLALDTATSTFYWSAVNDASDWPSANFVARSIAPDPWKAIIVDGKRLIWLIGEQTGEVWYDSGAADVPFEPVPGAVFRYGTPAPWSVASAGEQVMWLSQNISGSGMVVMTQGYTPQRISTHAVEAAINQYAKTSTIADAEAFVYQEQGHTFYVLTFPTANATWVYDLTTGLWHERGSWNSNTLQYDYWHPRWHAFAFGRHLVGDRSNGYVYEMDVTIPCEGDGTYIRRLRIPPPLACANRMARMSISRFELLLEPGTGNGSPVNEPSLYGEAIYGISKFGANPNYSGKVMMRTSQDIKTWGPIRVASSGALGDYNKRVTWYGCGSTLNLWVPEITVTDPIPWRLLGADVKGDNIANVTDAPS